MNLWNIPVAGFSLVVPKIRCHYLESTPKVNDFIRKIILSVTIAIV